MCAENTVLHALRDLLHRESVPCGCMTLSYHGDSDQNALTTVSSLPLFRSIQRLDCLETPGLVYLWRLEEFRSRHQVDSMCGCVFTQEKEQTRSLGLFYKSTHGTHGGQLAISGLPKTVSLSGEPFTCCEERGLTPPLNTFRAQLPTSWTEATFLVQPPLLL